jgi:aryl-alcohol dehydrogenase-like predicted oxidoreductase
MEFRTLGTSELKVSEVGLGCNNFGGRIDLEATRAVVHKCLDLGINLFDTADVYGGSGKSEEFLGEVLGSRRSEILIATKFGHVMSENKKGANPAYIRQAVDDSLSRLKTDVIDLYQLHTPDPTTPIEETLGALTQLVESGKVRFIGCSNLPAWEVADSLWISKTKGLKGFVSCQDEYSLLKTEVEQELIPMAEKFQVGILPYFPLASGLLTGKYKQDQAIPEGTRFAKSQGLADRYMTESNWKKVKALEAFAHGAGHTILELAFSWLLRKECVSSVIAGATKPEQVTANVEAASWKLSPQDISAVDEILKAG